MKPGNIVLGLLAFLLLVSSCKKIEYRDQKPQLNLIVKDIRKNPVSGASVNLYLTIEDFQAGINSIKGGTTDTAGAILFTELEEVNYFFYVERSGKNNRFGVAGTSNPLQLGSKITIETVIE
jgi:hypothetical protein